MNEMTIADGCTVRRGRHGPRVRSAGAVIGTSGCPLHEQLLASEAGFSRPSFEHHVEGPCAARRTWRKPPSLSTSANLASPAWAPRASPTSWASEVGTQIMVEAL